jgi:hypothetical protein
MRSGNLFVDALPTRNSLGKVYHSILSLTYKRIFSHAAQRISCGTTSEGVGGFLVIASADRPEVLNGVVGFAA